MEKDNKTNLPDGTINAVPFEVAQQQTFAWQNLIDPNTGKRYPKSFRFNKIDFLEIFKQGGVDFVEVYPAIDEDGSLRLFLVGVETLEDGTTTQDIIHTKSEASGIFDFAYPCPKTFGLSGLYDPTTFETEG